MKNYFFRAAESSRLFSPLKIFSDKNISVQYFQFEGNVRISAGNNKLQLGKITPLGIKVGISYHQRYKQQ